MKTLACLVFMIGTTAFGQQQEKIQVKFDCTCVDPVAARYATAMRDVLAKSPRYVETYLSKDPAKDGGDYWNISVVSLPVNSDDNAAALSIVFKIGNTYINHLVQVCGTNKVEGCADDTIAQMDSTIASLRESISRAWDAAAKQSASSPPPAGPTLPVYTPPERKYEPSSSPTKH